MNKYPSPVVLMLYGVACMTIGALLVYFGEKYDENSLPPPQQESGLAGSRSVGPTRLMRVSAYCPCKKTLDKYTVSWYNARNGIFERITDEQEMQKVWQEAEWATATVVFPTVCKPLLGKSKPATVHLFVRSLQRSIRKVKTGKCKGCSVSVLFSVMCQSCRGSCENQNSDATSTGGLYFGVDAGTPQRLRRTSNGTSAGYGETFRQAAEAIRMDTSQKSYHGRQSNRKPFAGKIQEPSPRTCGDAISNPAIYKKKGLAGRTDKLRQREVLQPIPEGKLYRVTAYCPKKCCCGKFADGYTASGGPAVGRIVAAPSTIPFGTALNIPGYGVALVQDRGGAITGNRLDVLFATHEEAKQWGVQELMVWEVK